MQVLSQIENNFESYQKLISFYEGNKDRVFDTIPVEIRNWFSANISAVLGAIFDKLTENVNVIQFKYIDESIESILTKNDFLTYFGKKRTRDLFNTTIRFQKLKPTDGKYFKIYVIDELIKGRDSDLPRMSEKVKEQIIEGIYEVFINAQIHSDTNFIYTCGQFFPNLHTIEFTIVDTGIGFAETVYRRFGKRISSSQAIQWAVKDRMTTKQGVSGGIGLAILREFVTANKGCMQIVSGNAFYEYNALNEFTRVFVGGFPGTIVNLRFKTDDVQGYRLNSEVDIKNIL